MPVGDWRGSGGGREFRDSDGDRFELFQNALGHVQIASKSGSQVDGRFVPSVKIGASGHGSRGRKPFFNVGRSGR